VPSGSGEQDLPGAPKQPGPRGVVEATVLVATADDENEDDMADEVVLAPDDVAAEVVPAPVPAASEPATRPPHALPISRTATTYRKRMAKV
jgi:hypothetical protein